MSTLRNRRLASSRWARSPCRRAVGPGDREPPSTRRPRRTASAGLVGAAEGRHRRRDRVVGRWSRSVDRLAGRDHEARAGHRRLPERRRSGTRREVRVPERPESATGLELVPRQPGRIQRRAVRAVQDDSRSRSEPREPDAAHDRPNLEARSDRAVPASGTRRLDVRPHRHRAQSDRLRRRRGAPRRERQAPLPFGFAFENPRIVRAAVGRRDDGLRRPAAGAARLPEHAAC